MTWQTATVTSVQDIATDIKAIQVSPITWTAHKPGQHYDLRLPGDPFEKSYSVMSPPELVGQLEFGIQLISQGALSPRLWKLTTNDTIQIRGPIGGHFIWEHTYPGDLVLIGGGAGMVPLLAMYRHHLANPHPTRQVKFIVSCTTQAKVINYPQLSPNLITRITSLQGHIDQHFLSTHLSDLVQNLPMIYICGPTAFVEYVADSLVNLNFNPHSIRTERFG
jgi:ferredoxin-NADP reductase